MGDPDVKPPVLAMWLQIRDFDGGSSDIRLLPARAIPWQPVLPAGGVGPEQAS
jgi:hypothetical protein